MSASVDPTGNPGAVLAAQRRMELLKRRFCLILFWISVLLIGLVEGWIGYELLTGSAYPLAYHLTIHALAVLFPSVLAGLFLRRGVGGWLVLLSCATAFLGIVGVVGVTISHATHLYYRRQATSFDDWYADLFPEEVVDVTRELAQRLEEESANAGATDLAPFREVMTFGTQIQKLNIIVMINRRFRPSFAPILRLAMIDDDNAVRVQAATAITHIENRFLAKTLQLEKLLAMDPNNAEAVLTLSRLYDDYAFTGLLDAERERGNRERALAGYKRYLELNPAALQARTAIGRLLLRNRRYDEALTFLERSLAAGYRSTQLHIWYMETLFNLGHFDQLQQAADAALEALSKDAVIPDSIKETVLLWATPEDHSEATVVTP